METMQCTKCDSEKVMTNLPVRDYQGLKVSIHIETNPNALLFRGNHIVDLFVNVCADCGDISLTVDDLKGLWQLYTQRDKN